MLRTNAPHHAKFHQARQNDVLEKRYKNILHLQFYGAPGGPPGPKFTNLGPDAHQAPPYQPAKFRPVLKTPLRDNCFKISSISLTA